MKVVDGEVHIDPGISKDPDPDIERAFNWVIRHLSPGEWDCRRAVVEAHLAAIERPAATLEDSMKFRSMTPADDRIAWYLYLVQMDLYEPWRCDPTQGARILPIFRRLGTHLDELVTIGGVDAQADRLLTPTNEPDSVLFELLIALLWKRNGFDDVAFIPTMKKRKTPDIRAGDWTVETKRMSARSEYAIREHEKWTAMWHQFKQVLVRGSYPFILDIVFHVEFAGLPDDFLVQELEGKLRLVTGATELIVNDTWTVRVAVWDKDRSDRHLNENYVKDQSRQLQELIGGRWDRGRGFTCISLPQHVRIGDGKISNRFVAGLDYAAGAFWSCDARESIIRKARDVKGQLETAIEQLPDKGKSAIHVGLETTDGTVVEKVRFGKIVESIPFFDSKGKGLHWIYCHLFESYSPPDKSWFIDETVYLASRAVDCEPDPLRFHPAVVGPDEVAPGGAHWDREAP